MHPHTAWRGHGLAVLPLCALLVTGCATLAPSADAPDVEPALGAAVAPATDDSLYRELGGHEGVSRITADMLREIAADERIRRHFLDTDIERLHRMLTAQFCVVAGGDCAYEGDTMRKSHAGLGISRPDFNALVEALMRAMDGNAVGVTAQNRLLARLAPMHGEIVED